MIDSECISNKMPKSDMAQMIKEINILRRLGAVLEAE